MQHVSNLNVGSAAPRGMVLVSTKCGRQNNLQKIEKNGHAMNRNNRSIEKCTQNVLVRAYMSTYVIP